jgi:hypothetical protein
MLPFTATNLQNAIRRSVIPSDSRGALGTDQHFEVEFAFNNCRPDALKLFTPVIY